MAHTYNAHFVHFVFSTKDRRNSIPSELQEQLWAYTLGTANNLKIKPLAVGGTSNHVHLLLGLPPTMTVAEAVQKLKANSSRWLGENGVDFQWQEGYGAFSVSPSLLDAVLSTFAINRNIIESGVSRMSFERCWTSLA
jgi:putative transposase